MGTRKGTKLSIVGAGAVGTSLAYAALINGLASEVALQDINEKKVRAEALDLAHGAAFMPPARISGSSDVAVTQGSDIVVITAGAKQQPGETRMDLAGKTVDLMKKIVPGIVEQSPDAVLLLVTNPVDVITQAALKISGLPSGRVIGSGTVLDSSRLRWLIASECEVAISSVHAVICGEHGDSEVPMWSTASIGGVPLLEWEEQTGKLGRGRRDVITRQTIDAAYEVIEGKGATNYAIGVAGSRILEAILRDEHAVLPVASRLDGWHGISDVCMSVPSVVGRHGVLRTLEPSVNAMELRGLQASAAHIREVAAGLGF
ncbi:MAG: L-lactate dehydrogenase [Tessaracoccus sp.]|uniref:L-lactate dehydrogenase n=1 Tax=Tessaracoccus sp. TaxID=1971211 RepID=UPI001EB1735A|nr:L-lactate dehydrogenase [Tessaracoccus sp.]MBK7820048.1 L-lactate dehydrogenase [Tessaracoccus sp.]